MPLLRDDRRGSVYVEFLIVVMPIVMLVLCVAQCALLYTGQLMVESAADRAARGAIVVLDDDPACYGGAPRDTISGSGAGGAMPRLLSWLGLPSSSSVAGQSQRLQDIRDAASMTLLPLAPVIGRPVGPSSIHEAIADGGTLQGLDERATYNRGALAVTFPAGRKSTSYRTSFGKQDIVTVRVTYLFHCAIPLARDVVCQSLQSARSGPAASDLAYAEAPSIMNSPTLSGARFVALRAETSLPNQGATYEYQGHPPCGGTGVAAW